MISQVGPSAKNNFLSIIFMLKIRNESLHSCRINCRVKLRTIFPYLNNKGVSLFPTCRLNITVKELQIKS